MKNITVDTLEMNEMAAEAARTLAPQPAPKPITASELKAAANAHAALGRQIAELEVLQPAIAKDFDSRCCIVDLDDKEALTEIARLQVLSAILPKRIEAKENQFLNSARALNELNGNFIHHTLGPRSRSLREKVANELRQVISRLVSDEFLIQRSVLESDPVQAINAIYTTWHTPSASEQAAEVYRILGSFELLQEYEKISASAIKQKGKISYSEAFSRNAKKNGEALQAIRDAWQTTGAESQRTASEERERKASENKHKGANPQLIEV